MAHRAIAHQMKLDTTEGVPKGRDRPEFKIRTLATQAREAQALRPFNLQSVFRFWQCHHESSNDLYPQAGQHSQ